MNAYQETCESQVTVLDLAVYDLPVSQFSLFQIREEGGYRPLSFKPKKVPLAEKIFNPEICWGDDSARSPPDGPGKIITREKVGLNFLFQLETRQAETRGETESEKVWKPHDKCSHQCPSFSLRALGRVSLTLIMGVYLWHRSLSPEMWGNQKSHQGMACSHPKLT